MGQWLPFKVGNVRSTKPPTTITSITCRGSRNCEQVVLFRYQVREEWVAMSVNVLSLRLCRCSIVSSKAANLQKCKLFSFNNAHGTRFEIASNDQERECVKRAYVQKRS